METKPVAFPDCGIIAPFGGVPVSPLIIELCVLGVFEVGWESPQGVFDTLLWHSIPKCLSLLKYNYMRNSQNALK